MFVTFLAVLGLLLPVGMIIQVAPTFRYAPAAWRAARHVRRQPEIPARVTGRQPGRLGFVSRTRVSFRLPDGDEVATTVYTPGPAWRTGSQLGIRYDPVASTRAAAQPARAYAWLLVFAAFITADMAYMAATCVYGLSGGATLIFESLYVTSFCILGAAAGPLGTFATIRAMWRHVRYAATTGTIVDLEDHDDTSYLVIDFTVASGDTVRIYRPEEHQRARGFPADVGDPVPLRYDPARPEATVTTETARSLRGQLMLGIIAMAVSAAMIWLAVITANF
ncbi:MAG: DUF3592 domain-containing protein [Nocardiopsaceae bacterium]|nr:DUF3592 domain-containing protein [Nocardiopsaceae bacterium]